MKRRFLRDPGEERGRAGRLPRYFHFLHTSSFWTRGLFLHGGMIGSLADPAGDSRKRQSVIRTDRAGWGEQGNAVAGG